MDLKAILEVVIGDVVLAAIIGGLTVITSNRNQKQSEWQLEKEMRQLKEIMELHFEKAEQLIKERSHEQQSK